MSMKLTWLCSAWLSAFALPAIAQVNVLTFRNDNARTGLDPNEPLLSPANVKAGQFGRRLSHAVDGNVFAQPLYVGGVPMAAGGVYNVVLVVTDHDSVYAFDADDLEGSDAGPLWQVSFLNASRGVTTAPGAAAGQRRGLYGLVIGMRSRAVSRLDHRARRGYPAARGRL